MCMKWPLKMKTRKKRMEEKKDEEAGWGVQGQVQHKSLSLVNEESAKNVNKQTAAVTHSYGEMHTYTHEEKEGGMRREEIWWRDGRRDQKGSKRQRKTKTMGRAGYWGTNTHTQTFALTRRAKTSNPLHKQTSALRGRIVSFVNTSINSNHTSHNSSLSFIVHAQNPPLFCSSSL